MDSFKLQNCLDTNDIRKVFVAEKLTNHILCLIKIYNRNVVDSTNYKKCLIEELKILKEIQHPNIVKLYEIKEITENYFFFMEYCNGGSLKQNLLQYRKLKNCYFNESIIQYLIKQIAHAVTYLNNKYISHREINLDNILLSYKNDADKKSLNITNSQIKIIHFGLATHFTPQKMDYNKKIDVWSVGALCYAMLIGETVYNPCTNSVPMKLSKEIVSFINDTLSYDGKKGIEFLLKHDFLTKNVSKFSYIDLSNKKSNTVSKTKTIWSVYNTENEEKLIYIYSDNNAKRNPSIINNLTKEEQIKRKKIDEDLNKIKVAIEKGFNIPKKNNISNNNNIAVINNLRNSARKPDNCINNFINVARNKTVMNQNINPLNVNNNYMIGIRNRQVGLSPAFRMNTFNLQMQMNNPFQYGMGINGGRGFFL